MFKVGQTVWCLMFGKGCVVSIKDYGDFPVVVLCGSYVRNYSFDGKYTSCANRTLFFSEPKINASTEPPFVPTYVKGDVVILYRQYLPQVMGIVSSETEEHLHLYSFDAIKKSSAFEYPKYSIRKDSYTIKKIGTFTE